MHCNENPIYVFPEKELRGLSPSFHIHVSERDFYTPRIGPQKSSDKLLNGWFPTFIPNLEGVMGKEGTGPTGCTFSHLMISIPDTYMTVNPTYIPFDFFIFFFISVTTSRTEEIADYYFLLEVTIIGMLAP
jgi:hypothetical protein